MTSTRGFSSPKNITRLRLACIQLTHVASMALVRREKWSSMCWSSVSWDAESASCSTSINPNFASFAHNLAFCFTSCLKVVKVPRCVVRFAVSVDAEHADLDDRTRSKKQFQCPPYFVDLTSVSTRVCIANILFTVAGSEKICKFLERISKLIFAS